MSLCQLSSAIQDILHPYRVMSHRSNITLHSPDVFSFSLHKSASFSQKCFTVYFCECLWWSLLYTTGPWQSFCGDLVKAGLQQLAAAHTSSTAIGPHRARPCMMKRVSSAGGHQMIKINRGTESSQQHGSYVMQMVPQLLARASVFAATPGHPWA